MEVVGKAYEDTLETLFARQLAWENNGKNIYR